MVAITKTCRPSNPVRPVWGPIGYPDFAGRKTEPKRRSENRALGLREHHNAIIHDSHGCFDVSGSRHSITSSNLIIPSLWAF